MASETIQMLNTAGNPVSPFVDLDSIYINKGGNKREWIKNYLPIKTTSSATETIAVNASGERLSCTLNNGDIVCSRISSNTEDNYNVLQITPINITSIFQEVPTYNWVKRALDSLDASIRRISTFNYTSDGNQQGDGNSREDENDQHVYTGDKNDDNDTIDDYRDKDIMEIVSRLVYARKLPVISNIPNITPNILGGTNIELYYGKPINNSNITYDNGKYTFDFGINATNLPILKYVYNKTSGNDVALINNDACTISVINIAADVTDIQSAQVNGDTLSFGDNAKKEINIAQVIRNGNITCTAKIKSNAYSVYTSSYKDNLNDDITAAEFAEMYSSVGFTKNTAENLSELTYSWNINVAVYIPVGWSDTVADATSITEWEYIRVLPFTHTYIAGTNRGWSWRCGNNRRACVYIGDCIATSTPAIVSYNGFSVAHITSTSPTSTGIYKQYIFNGGGESDNQYFTSIKNNICISFTITI